MATAGFDITGVPGQSLGKPVPYAGWGLLCIPCVTMGAPFTPVADGESGHSDWFMQPPRRAAKKSNRKKDVEIMALLLAAD